MNTGQCARLLGLDESTIVKACKKGDLYPARFAQGHRSRWVITRADAERYGRNLRERQIVDLLETGASAIEVYRRIPALDAGELAKAIDVWAKLTGTWVVQAPRGSYARWLQRFGLLSFRPRALRRLIELLIGDPYVQKLARLHVARVALAEPPSELNGHEADDDQGDNGDDQNAAE